MKNTDKIPYGLKDNKLVHVSKVVRGLNCGCICPACKSYLIAKKGTKKKHHFAHYNTNQCIHAYETTLHLLAKEILEKMKWITLPEVSFRLKNWKDDWYYREKKKYQINKVALEQYFDNIIPDVVLDIQNNRLSVEIAVTHKIDEQKLKKIRKLNISTIEIDLNKYEGKDIFHDLEDILIKSTKYKTWIYNSKTDNIVSEVESIFRRTHVRQVCGRLYTKCPKLKEKIRQVVRFKNNCIGCKSCIDYNLSSYGSKYVVCTGPNEFDKYEDFVNYRDTNKKH
jgi:hypothetical protein